MSHKEAEKSFDFVTDFDWDVRVSFCFLFFHALKWIEEFQ